MTVTIVPGLRGFGFAYQRQSSDQGNANSWQSVRSLRRRRTGASKYSPIVLAAYDTFVLQWSNTYAWRCPRERLLAHYDTHLGSRHLDIGPGTGWYLRHATYPTEVPEITLMDLNTNTMAMTTGRLAERGITPEVHTGSILAPIDPSVGVFDSVAANFVFHFRPRNLGREGSRVRTHRPGRRRRRSVLRLHHPRDRSAAQPARPHPVCPVQRADQGLRQQCR